LDTLEGFFAGDLRAVTEKLAYEYWKRRGRPLGSPEIDWFAAEQALAPSREAARGDFSLYGLKLGPNDGGYR